MIHDYVHLRLKYILAHVEGDSLARRNTQDLHVVSSKLEMQTCSLNYAAAGFLFAKCFALVFASFKSSC